MPRGAVLALAIPVTVLLGWRVVVAGQHALAEPNFAQGAPVAAPAPAALGAEAAARQRLARNPADATALLSLALELERQGKRDDADAAMRTAVRLAPGDPQSLLLVAGYYLRTGEEVPALTTLRRAVDSSPGDVADRVWPVFTAALGTGRHRNFFDAMARENPSWWPGFFDYACARVTRGDALQAVFAARAAAEVATPNERRCLVLRLQKDGQWTSAYRIWLNGLPLDQRQHVGYVFNGGFELPLSNFGFDWRIPAQDGAVVSTDSGVGVIGQHALNVSFVNQRYVGPPVYQYLVLVPGRYRMEGRVRSSLDAWLGLQWGLYCQDGAGRETVQLMHTDPFVGSTRWRDFRQDFKVASNCPAQQLRLELANPKQGASVPGGVAIRLKGTVWFDEVRVTIVD